MNRTYHLIAHIYFGMRTKVFDKLDLMSKGSYICSVHGQHCSSAPAVTASCVCKRIPWATSTNEGIISSSGALPCSWICEFEANSIADCMLENLWQEQHWPDDEPQAGVGRALHAKLHLGLGQVVGLRHDHVHLGAEQVGRQLGTAGVQTVWHLAGKQTFSQRGQPPAWQFFREQRTSHRGFSQRISQAVSPNFSHLNSQAGFSHWGSQTAGQVGSSHRHLQSGKQGLDADAPAPVDTCWKRISAPFWKAISCAATRAEKRTAQKRIIFIMM